VSNTLTKADPEIHPFVGWPKISRLHRPIVVTEKIDGSNAAVVITPVDHAELTEIPHPEDVFIDPSSGQAYRVYAQSRTRVITPEQDNHGFAKYVRENAVALIHDLGVGRHFGEWWGSGINRGYGLQKGEKRFSLFNTSKWEGVFFATPNMSTVPVLGMDDILDTSYIDHILVRLETNGSLAAPGFMNPEGIVVFHTHSNTCFKYTIGDDGHKG
jgi:hypothetical protein